MVSTIWGICLSLKANPSGANTDSFDTVLTRCDRGETEPRPDVFTSELAMDKLGDCTP